MASKKNENRETTAKGIIANPVSQTFEQFETRIAYTRSLVKAVEMVREKMQLDSNVMISVSELVQDEIKRVVYNPQLVFENMLQDFEEEEVAKSTCKDSETVIAYTMFEYSGQIWMKKEDAYFTDFIVDNSPVKFGKVETRSFIRMSAESYHNAKCIGVCDEERKEIKRFAIVPNDKLELCVKES